MQRRDFIQTTLSAAITAYVRPGSLRDRTFVATAPAPTDVAAFRAARRFATTSFGKIAYVERGTGNAALFVHGFPLNGFQWRGALDRLVAHRRCILLDWMASGYSEIPEGQTVTPADQAAMLGAFLDSLSIRTVDLVANDSGGMITQLFMARFPDRVRSVLFTNCDTEPDSPPAAVLPIIKQARDGTFADQALAPWVVDNAKARGPDALGGLCYMDPAHLTNEAIEYYISPFVSSPLRKAQINAWTLSLAPNPLAGVEAALKRINAPVRVLWGTGDKIFSQASADYLDRLFPKSRGVRRIPDAKLFFPEELPDVIAEEARGLWGVA
jgi:pimeloyl-ACP methyl ester carboxylesterase